MPAFGQVVLTLSSVPTFFSSLGAIKGISRIIFQERIDMDVIRYSEEYHRGVRKDHWVFHVRFLEFNLPPMGLDGKISPEVMPLKARGSR